MSIAADPPDRPHINGADGWPNTAIARRHVFVGHATKWAIASVVVLAGSFILAKALDSALTTPIAGAAMLGIVVLLLLLACQSGPFLLAPKSYWAWLRNLKPYAPTTFWGQAVNRFAKLGTGAVLLVAGGFIGTLLSKAERPEELTSAAGSLLVGIFMVGIALGWWVRLVVELAILHRRSIHEGQLPSFEKPQVWPLFAIIFIIGLGLILEVVDTAGRLLVH